MFVRLGTSVAVVGVLWKQFYVCDITVRFIEMPPRLSVCDVVHVT